MNNSPGISDDLSTKDKILVTPAVISGLLCLGLSFGIRQSVYRERFIVCCAIFGLCFVLADRKKILFLTFLCFFIVRATWSITLIFSNPQ